eukprot:1157897-Pelagomonas_calceolata.AAC.2
MSDWHADARRFSILNEMSDWHADARRYASLSADHTENAVQMHAGVPTSEQISGAHADACMHPDARRKECKDIICQPTPPRPSNSLAPHVRHHLPANPAQAIQQLGTSCKASSASQPRPGHPTSQHLMQDIISQPTPPRPSNSLAPHVRHHHAQP